MKIFEHIQIIDTQLFIILNKILNYNLLPWLLRIFTSLFDIKIFTAIYFVIICWVSFNLVKCAEKENIAIIQDKIFEKYFQKLINLTKFGTCYFLLGIILFVMKTTLLRARPCCSLKIGEFYMIDDLDYKECFFSFPSAHVAIVFLCLIFIWNKDIFYKVIFIMLTIFTASSRIALAKHYPFDTLASIPIAILVFIVGNILYIKYLDQYLKAFIIHILKK